MQKSLALQHGTGFAAKSLLHAVQTFTNVAEEEKQSFLFSQELKPGYISKMVKISKLHHDKNNNRSLLKVIEAIFQVSTNLKYN